MEKASSSVGRELHTDVYGSQDEDVTDLDDFILKRNRTDRKLYFTSVKPIPYSPNLLNKSTFRTSSLADADWKYKISVSDLRLLELF